MTHGLDTGFLVAAEVLEHPNHQSARTKLSSLVATGERFLLAPQVLAEFIHVVTDPKRFTNPLTMDAARDIAQKWWTAAEVTPITCDSPAITQFFLWHRRHSLGRKRILDTLLAATYYVADIRSILTTNPHDFAILGGFNCITP